MKRIDLDTWEEILVTLTRNKTRSLLTAFGIFWGIFMLIALMGGAKGMKDLLSQGFEGFATNSGFMFATPTEKAYKGFQQGRTWNLENKDIERVRKSVPEVDIITANNTQWGVNINYEEHTFSGTLKGLFPEYKAIEDPKICMGRYLNEFDVRENRKVCVIGYRIYETLFPEKGNPCGKFIEINGIYYRIIGVSSAVGTQSIQGLPETSVSIPFTTLQMNYNMGQRIELLSYTVKKGYSVSEVEKKIEQVIKKAHMIHPDDSQAVMNMNAEAIFSMVDNLFKGIRVLSWLVGLGCLLAGAIGVSNIMMVTVKERTTEIGIRRAIGARPGDILQQILSESIVLTGISGMLGILFAVFVLSVVEQGTSTPLSPTHFQIGFWEAIGTCVLVAVLGLLAGLAPAFRAMSVKPIDAIRDE